MKLTKFKDPLPIPPVLKPKWKTQEYTYYEIILREAKHAFHRELINTTVWGYEGIYPGPIIEVEVGDKVFVKRRIEPPEVHLFPIDHSVHGQKRNYQT